MEKIVLSNGMKLLYEKVPGAITSFTIALEAGANAEENHELGLAHLVEHMVFKGTSTYTEKEINDLCNEYLGFHNAMTNYPYVVYYGSCLKEDFIAAFRLYYDIVFNPAFKEEGFKEEISVILEELKEWGDDVPQHCEDMLFYNCFNNRRLKNLIIGEEELIKNYTLKDVKAFHNKHYTADNCVISIVSSIEIDEIIKFVEEQLQSVNSTYSKVKTLEEYNIPLYENPEDGIYIEENSSISGCKVQYIFPIHSLTEKEISMLHLFNEYFASGTSSILYDEIRTKRGLVYDIQGRIKAEKGIKLYTLTLSTSKENLQMVKNIIKENIEGIKLAQGIFDEAFFKKYMKSQRTKRMLSVEKSIVMSMHLAVYEIMYGDGALLLHEFDKYTSCKEEEMIHMLNKVFINESIGIIRS